MSSGAGSEEASQTFDERIAEEQRGAQKLNNVVQQFFIKGALVIVSSRYTLRPWMKLDALKVNKWVRLSLLPRRLLCGLLHSSS